MSKKNSSSSLPLPLKIFNQHPQTSTFIFFFLSIPKSLFFLNLLASTCNLSLFSLNSTKTRDKTPSLWTIYLHQSQGGSETWCLRGVQSTRKQDLKSLKLWNQGRLLQLVCMLGFFVSQGFIDSIGSIYFDSGMMLIRLVLVI